MMEIPLSCWRSVSVLRAMSACDPERTLAHALIRSAAEVGSLSIAKKRRHRTQRVGASFACVSSPGGALNPELISVCWFQNNKPEVL